MRRVVLFPVFLTALILCGCEFSTQGQVGERHFLHDGTPYFIEHMGWFLPDESDVVEFNFVLAAATPAISLGGLTALADRATMEELAGTAERFGFERVRVTARSGRSVGFRTGPALTVTHIYDWQDDGSWSRSGNMSGNDAIRVLSEQSIDFEGTDHTLQLIHDSEGYISHARSMGYLRIYQCTSCAHDLETVTRLTLRRVLEMAETGEHPDGATLFAVRMFSHERSSQWQTGTPVTLFYQRQTPEDDWPEAALSEDNFVLMIQNQISQSRLEGEAMRNNALASR